MKTAIFIYAAMLTGISYGQVKSSFSRTTATVPLEKSAEQEVLNEPDSVTIISSGRFAKPVVMAKPLSEEQPKSEPVKSTSARKPE